MAFAAYLVRPDRTYYTSVWNPYPIRTQAPPKLARDTLWRFLNAFGPSKPVTWQEKGAPAQMYGVQNPGQQIVQAARGIPGNAVPQMVQNGGPSLVTHRRPSVGAGVTARVMQATAAGEPFYRQTSQWTRQSNAANSGTFFDIVQARQRELAFRRG